ncbi:hypothetical protein ACFVS2_20690 [Brevibacillus sp. NPDC058079]|uniref:hypothetical protein n=1 Tax=Brevibacillus sp. NPDC058079 TaxID=3346330 RepID=UPI0036E09FA3
MNKNKVKQIIVNHIKKASWFTYPQLLRVLEAEGVKVHGTYNLEMKEKNVALWGGLSEVVVLSISELMNEGRVVGMAAPIELYQIEGFDQTQPIILSVPEGRMETSAVFLTYLRYIPELNNNVVPLAQ